MAELDESVPWIGVPAVRRGDDEGTVDLLRHESISTGPPDVLLLRVRYRKTGIRKYA